jgi:hypothetical protein
MAPGLQSKHNAAILKALDTNVEISGSVARVTLT